MAEGENPSWRDDGALDEPRPTALFSESKEQRELISRQDGEEDAPALSFPVVAMGASAGGLEAFTRLLQHLPADTGMAFVLIQHLSRQHASQLASLLSRATSMPVVEVEQGAAVEPNHVYVIPPNQLMTISRGLLELTPRPAAPVVPWPINEFFCSLARDQKAGAVGVLLSGTDSDGALGLQAIREEGGIAMAQSEDSASFPGMPHSAVQAGPVDVVLPPEELARELSRIGQYRALSAQIPSSSDVGPSDARRTDEQHLNAILALLRTATGVDFQGYKRDSLRRRIARRMVLQRHRDLGEYASHVETHRPELAALYEDILIHVTSFFRDPDTFLALQEKILPELLRDRSSFAPLRLWVPGCATGEEVYSLAMCLLEFVSQLSSPVPIQIFGTDLSERVIARARSAIYGESQIAPLSPERRRQFFVPVDDGYQIVKPVRELCVFARHNVCADPPFSRMNLISCRNLLIYLGSALQRQVVATFHYALQPGGYLLLGTSEGLQGFPGLFSSVDPQHKLFQRSAVPKYPRAGMIRRGFAPEQRPVTPLSETIPHSGFRDLSWKRTAERMVLTEYGPPWVVVNDRFEIVHTAGDTSSYLQLPAGAPTLDLLKMVRESLRSELRNLLAKAKSENLPAQSILLRERIGGHLRQIGLQVRRLPSQASQSLWFLVIFFSSPAERMQRQENEPAPQGVQAMPGSSFTEAEGLREELALISQRLQAAIDERDAAYQELTSSHEEIQSSNEELRSINEELETAKEELQSSNEELSTLNEELQNRNSELSLLGDDLANLMSSTTIPILLLDHELRIRRMTPAVEKLLNVRPSDLGRPIGEIRMQLSVDTVEALARSVLDSPQPREVELQDREGCWRALRVQPYRTRDHRIEGVVLALIDIDQLRRAKQEATVARQFAETVTNSVPTPLLVLREDLRIRLANQAFYQRYGLPPAQVEDQCFLDISRKQWDLPGLRHALEKVWSDPASVQELEFEGEFAGQGQRIVCLSLRSLQAEKEKLILITIEDITAQKNTARVLVAGQEQLKSSVEAGTAALRQSEAALLRSREELRGLTASLLHAQEEERRRISRELHDDLSQKVAKLQFDIETLEQGVPFTNLAGAREKLRQVGDQAGVLANDLRRVAHGLHPSSLDHLGLTVALRSYAEEFSRSTAIPVQFTSRNVPRRIPAEVASCFYRIAQEALRNVGKHAREAAVNIVLTGSSHRLHLSIRDNGDGFDMMLARAKGGLGLISMQERVRLVQGKFSLETQPGHGVHLSVTAPLPSETT